MNQSRHIPKPAQPEADLDFGELAQEIDSPLGDLSKRRDEPTLTKDDFDELELALDF